MKTKRQKKKIKKKTKNVILFLTTVLGGAASFLAYFCPRDGVPHDTGQGVLP